MRVRDNARLGDTDKLLWQKFHSVELLTTSILESGEGIGLMTFGSNLFDKYEKLYFQKNGRIIAEV